MTGIVRLDQPAKVQVASKFLGRFSTWNADSLCQARIHELRTLARKIIVEWIDRADASANLATLAMDGATFAIPRETGEEYQREHEKRKAELLRIIESALDAIQVESDDNTLSIRFTQPASLSRLSKSANYAWAKMDESFGRFLFNAEEFDRADEVLQRITVRLPEEPGAWLRRAWQLSYNMIAQFDGYEARYAWIRRGIRVLLDGTEQNLCTTDLLWMAARFISHKVGESDDRAAFRELFSKDEELHKRLAKHIDLDNAKSPNETIDNFLVAKLLFEHCIERHIKDGATSAIPPLVFFSRPAATQAKYAESLGRSGQWDEAQRAWKEAERLHNTLGAETIDAGNGNRIRLNELETRRAKFGANDPSVKHLKDARKLIRYDFWLMRCRLEQTDEVQSARKRGYEAAELAKQSRWNEALEHYGRSLEILAELSKRHPEEMSLLAADFSDVASGYRKAQKQLSEADEESLTPILELIKTAPSLSTFPLTLDPEEYGND
jgi:tetratricopeptide (TPR) repeat protein